MKEKYIYETRMQVRDYECDIEGIVNNANYLHYCEHTRHLFLQQCGLSFAEMHEKGVDAVLARMTMQFKIPLRPDDEFLSRLRLTKEGIKYVFFQDIYRASDNKLVIKAQVDTVTLVNGRLSECEEFSRVFAPFVSE